MQHTPLSPTEWRTFVVRWDGYRGTISVYDTEKLILSYVSNKTDLEFFPIKKYNLFLRSSETMLVRFHTCKWFKQSRIGIYKASITQ